MSHSIKEILTASPAIDVVTCVAVGLFGLGVTFLNPLKIRTRLVRSAVSLSWIVGWVLMASITPTAISDLDERNALDLVSLCLLIPISIAFFLLSYWRVKKVIGQKFLPLKMHEAGDGASKTLLLSALSLLPLMPLMLLRLHLSGGVGHFSVIGVAVNAMIVPTLEEWAFRYYLPIFAEGNDQESLGAWEIVIFSLAFQFLHFRTTSFLLFPLSVYLYILRFATKRVRYPIVCHVGWNLVGSVIK